MKRKLTAAAAVSACVLLALTSSTAQAAGADRGKQAGPVLAAEGTGHGINVGTVPLTTTQSAGQYLLKDPTRGDTQTLDGTTMQVLTDADNVWGDGTPANRQSAGVDAQFSGAAFWDYFKDTFNRLGILGDGVGVKSVVHYGSHYPNAFWDDACFCVRYGDGAGDGTLPISLDIAGHEFTHGLTAATAGLIYSGESGALNEATSDLFGTMVEWHANIPADTPDYLIGEEFAPGQPVRRMDRPSLDGASADCWSSAIPDMDIHYSSGVADHFFYLLAEGSGAKVINGVSYNSTTCNGTGVTGIGRDKVAAVWYRALTQYMTANTNYKAARTATINAARALYGSSSPEATAVATAWSAVNVA